MKLLCALVLLVASASAIARIPAAFDPIVVEAPFSFSEREFDLTPAFERARAQQKPLYVYLGANDCPPCHEYTRFLEANAQQLQPYFAKVVVVDIRSWLKGPKIVFKIYGKAYSPKQFQRFVGDVALKQMPSGSEFKYTNVENHIEALRVPD
jgi:thiol-disulfide isomerase/thioredoxin